MLNLDDVGGVSSALQGKLRQRVGELNERKISVLKIFQEADQVKIREGECSRVQSNRANYDLVHFIRRVEELLFEDKRLYFNDDQII